MEGCGGKGHVLIHRFSDSAAILKGGLFFRKGFHKSLFLPRVLGRL